MNSLAVLQANLLSPVTLGFALGVAAKLVKSDLALPKDLYTSLSSYLLFALGLRGGVELGHASFHAIALPVVGTLFIGCITPVTAYLGMRRIGGFSVTDSAAVAVHYGAVSAVTFIAAQQFCVQMQLPVEGFLPTLLTLLEIPGITIALLIGVVGTTMAAPATVAVGSTMAVGGATAIGYGSAVEDMAMLQTLGEHGLGLFAVPTVMRRKICRRYHVVWVGELDKVRERFYAISVERRITHPAVRLIADQAKRRLFA